jgi:ABC-type multidrug transport system fused ATPase/permease subunit
MKRISNLLAWGAVAIVAALAVLNWSTLMAAAPLDLVVAQVQAPLGVVMLGLAAVLVALFFVATMRNQIGSLLETRRLLQEIQRVQNLADKAEASRIENLHQLIASEFRLLNERLSASPRPIDPDSAESAEPTGAGKDFKPLSLTEIVTGHEKR